MSVSEDFIKLTNRICEEYIDCAAIHLCISNDTEFQHQQKRSVHKITRHILNCCKTQTMKLSYLERIDDDCSSFASLFSGGDALLGDGEQFSLVLHRIFDSMFYKADDRQFNVNWGRVIVMFHYASIFLHKLHLLWKRKNSSNVVCWEMMKRNCVSSLQHYFLYNSDLCRWIEHTKGGWRSVVDDVQLCDNNNVGGGWWRFGAQGIGNI